MGVVLIMGVALSVVQINVLKIIMRTSTRLRVYYSYTGKAIRYECVLYTCYYINPLHTSFLVIK